MIIKQCQFAGRDTNGEHIHVLQAGYDNESLTKLASAVASPPQLGVIQRFMKDLPRRNGKLYTLISALGAGEYWGSNSNADYFGEEPLLHIPPGWDQLPHNQQIIVGKKWAWGYPTFYNAHAFAHHQNKDPNRAFGSIEYVMWDPNMKRVLLIVAFDRARAARFGSSGVLDRVENGEFPSVSMGCFPPGTPILMADGSEADIEVVREGDLVKTHRGLEGRVAQVHRRRYVGTMYDVKVHGHRRRLQLTDEHPLWVIGEEQLRCRPHDKGHNRGLGCETSPSFEPSWVRADEVQVGDRLLFPVPSKVDTTLDNPLLLELLGYYLAEGFVHKYNDREDAALTFCLSSEETRLRDRIIELGREFGAVAHSSWEVPERHGLYVSLMGCEGLAAACRRHCNSQAKSKRLSSELMHADPELQKVFLGAYWRGDGGLYDGQVSGLYFSTASEELADQLFVVLARCGVIASINRIVHTPSASSVVQIETVEFQVWVGKQFIGVLAEYCGVEAPELKTIKPLRFFLEYEGVTYIASPVEEVIGEAYDGPVHNFAVDGDDSYVAAQLSVHNCRVPYDICSYCADWSRITLNPRADIAEHKRRPIQGLSTETSDYCTHLKNELNKIYPDGRKVVMMNMHPRFFDLSVVFIGADKTSFVLAKLAGQCPIQPGASACKSCRHEDCVPSAHVHEVWSRGSGVEKTAVEMEHGATHTGVLRVAGQKPYVVAYDPTAKGGWKARAPTQAEFDRELRLRRARGLSVDLEKAAVSLEEARDLRGKLLKNAQGLEDLEWEDPKTEWKINDYLKKKRMKVGRIKTSALSKDAEIIKQVQSNFRRNLPRLQREEPAMPREVQDLLSERMADALSTAGSMGIVAKPREFQRIYIRAIGRPGLADELDDKGLVFRTGARPAPDFGLSGSIIPKILKALLPLMEMRSALTPSIAKRTIIVIKKRPRHGVEDESGCAELDHPLMDKVSSAYSAYRRDLLFRSPELIKQAVFAHPEVHHALHGDSVLEGGLVKSGGDVMESVIGMLTSTYLNEAYLDEPVSEFVGENCNLAGLEKAAGLAVLGGVA